MKTDEQEQEKEKAQKLELKSKEQERKWKEAETLKSQVEYENWVLKRENEKSKYVIAQLKEKFGKEKVEKEINTIENIEKQKDDEIKKLKDEIEKEKLEKQKIIEEKEKEKTEKENLKVENAKLLEEVEKYKLKPAQVIINQDFPIQIINYDPSSFGFADVDGVQKKITNLKSSYNSVSLTQDMIDGIWSMEGIFQNKQDRGSIGIVKATRNLVTGKCPCCEDGYQDIAFYGGCCCQICCLAHNNNRHSGNTKYGDNQLVRAELDFGKETLTFFLDNVQQPVYIYGIREKVREHALSKYIMYYQVPEEAFTANSQSSGKHEGCSMVKQPKYSEHIRQVSDLKLQIEDSQGVPTSEQKLTFKKLPLTD
ncbi:MAG: hypothetical protein EZS28_041110, partial [Streblomastix strix]